MNGDKLKMSALLGFELKKISINRITYADGYNQALSELDQREIDVEALAKEIQKAGREWEDYDDPITPLWEYLAQHLAANAKGWIVKKG
jgi:hypothetical protein